MKWNAFHKTHCGTPAGTTTLEPTAAQPATTATKPAPAPAPSPAAVSDVVFPRAISPKYTGQSAAKARLHTCLDQYKANRTNNANGTLRWLEKGGGYYSECTKRMKVAGTSTSPNTRPK
jgi:hypothetical protein